MYCVYLGHYFGVQLIFTRIYDLYYSCLMKQSLLSICLQKRVWFKGIELKNLTFYNTVKVG